MQRPRAPNRVAPPSISAIIPAFNEEKTVGEIVSKTLRYVDEVIVIDEGSTDDTGAKAAEAGARVIRNEENADILKSLKVGFESAVDDVIVTLDADGQHDPDEIPLLLGPILEEKGDMALGARAAIPYFSERVIARLTSLRVSVKDASTGVQSHKGRHRKENGSSRLVCLRNADTGGQGEGSPDRRCSDKREGERRGGEAHSDEALQTGALRPLRFGSILKRGVALRYIPALRVFPGPSGRTRRCSPYRCRGPALDFRAPRTDRPPQ